MTWKRAERRVAKALGGKRLPVSGTEAPDVVTEWVCVEVKYRRAFPLWLTEALDRAVRHAKDSQLPVAVLVQRGRRTSNAMVVLKLKDFREHFGELRKREGD